MTTGKRSFGSFPARWGLAADLACFALFVLMGRQSHDLGGGVGWFATVFWPFAAAWLISAFAVRPYSPGSTWCRVGLTLLLAIPLAMVFRVWLTGRAIPVTFVLVSACFSALLLFIWRALATVAIRIR